MILVTADGLRWQELFHGIDPLLGNEKTVAMAASSESADVRRRRFASRDLLLPFFWNVIAKKWGRARQRQCHE